MYSAFSGMHIFSHVFLFGTWIQDKQKMIQKLIEHDKIILSLCNKQIWPPRDEFCIFKNLVRIYVLGSKLFFWILYFPWKICFLLNYGYDTN